MSRAIIVQTVSALSGLENWSSGSNYREGEEWYIFGSPALYQGFLCGSSGKEFARNAGDLDSIPGLGRSSGEFHGLYRPWGHKESDTTERLSLSLSLHVKVIVKVFY